MIKNSSLRDRSTLLVLFLVPLSSMAVLIGNFSLFDAVLIAFILVFGIKYKGDYTSSAAYFLAVYAVCFFSIVIIVEYGIYEDAVQSLGQLLYILLFLPFVIQSMFTSYKLENFLRGVLLVSLFLSLALLISPLVDNPFIKFDLVSRYQPRTSGTTAIYIIAFSYMSFLYSKRKLNIWYFSGFLLFSLAAVYLTGQRSMLLGLLLILMVVALRRGVILGCILLAVTVIVSVFLAVEFSLSSRLTDNLFSDSYRITIIMELFESISAEPLKVITGWGVGLWTSREFNQEPHNNFLHLITDYGIFVAMFYSLIVYRFAFSFFKFRGNQNGSRIFYVMVTLGAMPYYMTHTYSLERGNIFLFMVVSFYFLKEYKSSVWSSRFNR
ncbi:MAG: O-antigen ligase family protein [Colwellia sp.]